MTFYSTRLYSFTHLFLKESDSMKIFKNPLKMFCLIMLSSIITKVETPREALGEQNYLLAVNTIKGADFARVCQISL